MTYLLLYPNVKAAMQAEAYFQAKHYHVRIVSTPESIKATCGFSLELTTTSLNQALTASKSAEIEAIYQITGTRLSKKYQLVTFS